MIHKDSAEIKGQHILSICDARSDKATTLQNAIEDCARRRNFLIDAGLATGKLLRALWDEYNYYLKTLHNEFKLREVYVENITTTVGRSVLAQILGGDTTYTGIVNYTALGSNNTPEVVADATLGTEVYRKALTSGTDLNNICYLETFFTASETTGTYEEYGMFIDGAAGANTGQLFNRFTTSVTKTAVETLNVQSIVTFADA